MRKQILPFDDEKCNRCPFLVREASGCDMIVFAANGGRKYLQECCESIPFNCPAGELLEKELVTWQEDLSGLDLEIVIDGALGDIISDGGVGIS